MYLIVICVSVFIFFSFISFIKHYMKKNMNELLCYVFHSMCYYNGISLGKGEVMVLSEIAGLKSNVASS